MAVTLGIVMFVMMACAVYKAVGAICTSFTYNRGSACSDNLTVSTFSACSSKNLTVDLLPLMSKLYQEKKRPSFANGRL